MAGASTRSPEISWSELETITSAVKPVAADAIRGCVPKYVIEPSSAEQVATVLRWANRNSVALAPRGNGTKLGWGNPPRSLDVVVSTRKMNRILEHAWGDMTATVEPGCTVAELQRTLAEHGQRLAVEPLFPECATIGGMLAANDNGALRVRFGSLRDLIIGVTLVLPDGTLARSGGKVVKNVAGYDLPKLAVGSLGTLGIITQAIFRLHPLPPMRRTLSFQFATLAAANRAVLALMDSVLTFTGLQLRSSSSRLGMLDVRFEGVRDAVDDQARRAEQIIAALLSVAGGEPLATEAGAHQQTSAIPNASHVKEIEPANAEDPWQSSTALWDGAPDCICRFSVLPTEIASFLDRVHSLTEPLNVKSTAVVQAVGVGLLRFDGATDVSLSIIEQLRQLAGARNGSVVVLHAPDALLSQLDPWGDGMALAIMRRMKQQFDPNGILNPGRFVGGI